MKDSEKIRIGIVGLGRAGWRNHFQALTQRDDAQVVAIVDPLVERRAEAMSQADCQAFTTLGRMLKQVPLDVVVVATPSHYHSRQTRQALRAGCHVVVEKPMALSVGEADGMIRLAQDVGKNLFVHQNYRFNRLFTHINQIARSGIIGRVYHIRYFRYGFNRRNDWQTLSRFGGGVLNNKGAHEIDMVLQLMGAPVVEVMGDLQQIAAPGDAEDHCKAFLRAANGCTADLEFSDAQNIGAVPASWVLCGSCGTVVTSKRMSTVRFFDPDRAAPIEVNSGAAEGRLYGNNDVLPWQEKTMVAEGPNVGTFYDNVVGVLQEGEPMRVTVESVRETIRVMAVIRKGTSFGRRR